MASPETITARLDSKVKVQLFWDLFPGTPAVDLDCSAVLFDQCGVLYDCAFYNNLNACGGALVHSGDAKDGARDGPDEQITVDLYNVPANVYIIALLVNAHHSGDLSQVETARVNFLEVSGVDQDHQTQIHAASIPCSSQHTGVVIGLLVRGNVQNKEWNFSRSGVTCAGRSFVESMPSLRQEVDRHVDPVLLMERTLNMDKTFNMHKGDVVEIPADLFKGGADAFIGLGWSCTRSIDLDASVLAFDERGNKIAKTNFSEKHGIKGVEHQGDNVTGAGSGDDEKILIDFDVIEPAVKELYFVVNIYSSSATFNDVRDAYIRLVAEKNKKVLARFDLSGSTVSTRGLVFLRAFRRPLTRSWGMEAMGRGCGGSTCQDPSTVSACTVLSVSSIQPPPAPAVVRPDPVPAPLGPSGTLKIKVLNAEHVPSMDLNGYSDPYVKILQQDTNQKFRTSVQKKNLSPMWNEEFPFNVYKTTRFLVSMWDKDHMTADDRIGDVTLDAGSLIDWDTGVIKQSRMTTMVFNKQMQAVAGKDHMPTQLHLEFSFQKQH